MLPQTCRRRLVERIVLEQRLEDETQQGKDRMALSGNNLEEARLSNLGERAMFQPEYAIWFAFTTQVDRARRDRNPALPRDRL